MGDVQSDFGYTCCTTAYVPHWIVAAHVCLTYGDPISGEVPFWEFRAATLNAGSKHLTMASVEAQRERKMEPACGVWYHTSYDG